ncbi:MAG: zinc-binding dehydrogenase [Acidobacteriota bacterium]
MLRRHGGPGVLQVGEAPAPEPGPDEVAVDVAAIGINYAEVLSRKGLYGWAPALPYVLGMEATGRIAAIGEGVTDRRVGEPVIVGAQTGCYAERVVVPATQALPAPPGYSIEESAAFAVNYMTAWVSLMEMARLRPSDRVLITAAAGGVGTAGLQIAKAFGCTVYGAAGSDAKLPLLRQLGADAAISYGAPEFAERVRAAARASEGNADPSSGNSEPGPAMSATAPVDVVLEVVGGRVFHDSMDLLAPFGRMVVAGFAGYELRWWNPLTWWRTWRDMPRAGVGALARGSRGLLASHIGYLLKDPRRTARVWRALADFAAAHEIRPHVGHTFAFDEIADAHRLMESRRSSGKIVVYV